MEPVTHDDIWETYLGNQPNLATPMQSVMSPATRLGQLVSNLTYACCMARIKYFRSPLALPSATDAAALATYHVQVYNAGGKANAATNTPLFQQAIEA
jgi:hypothetical protein